MFNPRPTAHKRAKIKRQEDDESMDGQRGPFSRSSLNLENEQKAKHSRLIVILDYYYY